jgi:23S rRNA (cytosine1962-C5)-methyltransferase
MIFPRLHLNQGTRHRILTGHPWVFASEVEKIEGDAEDGETIDLVSAKGVFLGRALYNSRSQIVARRYALEPVELDAAWLSRRLDAALAFRGKLPVEGARRLVWSESDQLPGLIVDFYAGVLVVQTLTLALARREKILVELLREKTGATTILARNDAPVRQLEGLPLERVILHGDYPGPTAVQIAGIRYRLDLWSGQKTGFYLDQQDNYGKVACLCAGRRVLDCFTNQGAFALAARKAGAIFCRAVDQSAEALKLAETTASEAGLEVEWMQANVFDLLRHYEQRRERFDVVILDPPSFTKTKGNKASALRGYHELHLRALRLLTPGGLLATFSCSHHVTAADWTGLLERAATETGFTLRLRRRLTQSQDHPILVNVPETEYLQGYVVEKIGAS